jgi:Virulence protein
MENNRQSEIILYRTDDGRVEIELHTIDDDVWLTQNEIAQLFDTTRANITTHIKNIYVDGELPPGKTRKEYLPTLPGKIRKGVQLYNLPMILAIGFRVRSPRGVQFRQWATRNLSEYLAKGFVMNDERLKNPDGHDYFDELLARIRDIRASEKRFYQKVRDLFALSDDYEVRKNEDAVRYFFANIQNMLLYAVTERTAAELVVMRSDPGKPNMNLKSWDGTRPRREDIFTAKNYLNEDELDSLNRLVVMFLDRGEFAAKRRQQFTLAYWQASTAELLRSNDLPILEGYGNVSRDDMKRIVSARYDEFDDNRKAFEAQEADSKEINELEQIAKLRTDGLDRQ